MLAVASLFGTSLIGLAFASRIGELAAIAAILGAAAGHLGFVVSSEAQVVGSQVGRRRSRVLAFAFEGGGGAVGALLAGVAIGLNPTGAVAAAGVATIAVVMAVSIAFGRARGRLESDPSPENA
jgi:hypothetical protein